MKKAVDDPQIPGYTVTSVLGKGSMGVVYRGLHVESGQEVAIKSLQSEDPSLQRALANEWEVLQKIEHPYLINERELITHNQNIYLIMEYFESVTLLKWIEQTEAQQRLEQAAPLFDKVCQVLAYLHGQSPPVIVRDLKPENILVTPTGEIKLIDFGIARTVAANSHTELALKGFATAAYAPLEQYTARSTTTPASDVYSLGATAYHFLVGKPPASAIDLMTDKQEPAALLREAGVHAQWATLIGKAMRQKAAERISVEEFRKGMPGPLAEVVLPEKPVVVVKKRDGRLAWLALAASAAAALWWKLHG